MVSANPTQSENEHAPALKAQKECPSSANSSLAEARQPNDRTEVTLPDAEIDHRN
jgi:hypothetical protein